MKGVCVPQIQRDQPVDDCGTQDLGRLGLFRMIDNRIRVDDRLINPKIEQEAKVRAKCRLGNAVAAFASTHVEHLALVQDIRIVFKWIAAESGTEEVAQEGIRFDNMVRHEVIRTGPFRRFGSPLFGNQSLHPNEPVVQPDRIWIEFGQLAVDSLRDLIQTRWDGVQLTVRLWIRTGLPNDLLSFSELRSLRSPSRRLRVVGVKIGIRRGWGGSAGCNRTASPTATRARTT